MGRDVNLVQAESQDHGPVLPWMRDPLDIDAYKATSLRQVPGLDTRLQDAFHGRKTIFVSGTDGRVARDCGP
ncbi:hypothetical protein MARPO_3382s0001 [Marchantia polymorpha]|uniref:Uncharacterized protein n=1 Tax=Marchantia polymorpha TaxID=3197 RepID=A0A2R6VXE9_MARPO|nr:hypothetical protein MARPO_3382s0001 [Marchantia polymorpha]|eukprot:PTQ26289.1 hypothetical protein MARPO_3382s0001 [Marchantia polymorpha]